MQKDQYHFTIFCFGPNPNPMGYKRTLNHSMREDGRKYMDWQQEVRARFLDESGICSVRKGGYAAPLVIPEGKRARMNILIMWANERHADPDNVWKGIADSLFVDDKHLFGSFTYMHTPGSGGVEVSITFMDEVDTPGPLQDDVIAHTCGPGSMSDRGMSRNEGTRETPPVSML